MPHSQTITIRLPEEAARKLTFLATQRRTTRTAVIRSALKALFDETFGSVTTSVSLNDAAWQALAYYQKHGPDEETKRKRQRFLEKHRGWK